MDYAIWTRISTLLVLLICTVAAAPGDVHERTVPAAILKNGSYYGVHSPQHNQDFFLGVPFAQPPVGDLRLRRPQSLNSTWHGIRGATEYGYACVGYGEDTFIGGKNHVSEDCLTLNIVRPTGRPGGKLPVVVWIYGGGWYEGTSLDPRYNLTFLVEQSVANDKPIIAVSINYRLHGWGWLYSDEVLEAGVANLGLRDQRLALHWLQENIHAFGGDPARVTIWGESAGAANVGHHILAYNGRDEGLFHGAISQSGPFGFGLVNPTISRAKQAFRNITRMANCSNSIDKLDCLRRLSFEAYNDTLTAYAGTAQGTEDYYQVTFGPLVDHDIVVRPALDQLLCGDFVRVPYILGDNSDEGTDFVPMGLNTDAQFLSFFKGYGLSNATLHDLARLYPDNPRQDIPASHPRRFNRTIGLQFKRAATLEMDLAFKAPRRLAAQAWLNHTKAPLYTYRFNTIPNGIPDVFSVTHFQEVSFVFHNIHGQGYPDMDPPYFGADPFAGKGKKYKHLSNVMSRMWAHFVATGNPNFGTSQVKNLGVPQWPLYSDGLKDIVFDAERGSHVEVDDYRKEGIDYLIERYKQGGYPWGQHDES